MPHRTFYCFATTSQEADEWVKLLRWKMVRFEISHVSG